MRWQGLASVWRGTASLKAPPTFTGWSGGKFAIFYNPRLTTAASSLNERANPNGMRLRWLPRAWVHGYHPMRRGCISYLKSCGRSMSIRKGSSLIKSMKTLAQSPLSLAAIVLGFSLCAATVSARNSYGHPAVES